MARPRSQGSNGCCLRKLFNYAPYSNWSREYLRIFAYAIHKDCQAIWCGTTTEIHESRLVKVLVAGEVFTLEGNNGNFAISDDLAHALANAPEEEAKIKVYLEESGNQTISDIGVGTVRSWRTVYEDARFLDSNISETPNAETPPVDAEVAPNLED